MEKKKMTRESAIELLKNRKVYVNGKSAEIQKKLFELGFEWPCVGKEVIKQSCPFLYTSSNSIFGGDDMIDFIKDDSIEISAEEILAIEVAEELKEVFGIEECPFKPFDKVLVRNGNGMAWGARLFDRMYAGDYACTDSLCYKQCIPFEGNESLHGTADSPNNQKKEVE